MDDQEVGRPPSGPSSSDDRGQRALYVAEMQWWTSDKDLCELGERLGLRAIDHRTIRYDEHKINGKSKGIAYLECADQRDAEALATWLAENDLHGKRVQTTYTYPTDTPFRNTDKHALGPRDQSYRGRGGFPRGGGGGYGGGYQRGGYQGGGRGGQVPMGPGWGGGVPQFAPGFGLPMMGVGGYGSAGFGGHDEKRRRTDG